ncbi:MAG: single-stranded-DNA-specific exonuclease RecJ [candidate division KSB1 bacterium]|jgi:single-stranded-DNA-specific exonuclease|nr:single-stranded-DNA-specific exonuclease RecJ [candidate division KSB1 bacterium]
MELTWILDDASQNQSKDCFSERLQIPKTIADILIKRGVDTDEKAIKFFTSSIEDLFDPFLLPDMKKAAERIIQAINNNEKILVYGDYDVDGITSVSLLYMFCQNLGADVTFYIPNRMREGYGLSRAGIEDAHHKGVALIISVDCGITAVEEVAFANSLGIDVIISDHHEPGRDAPEALAILDPKCKDAEYPFTELAGVGVTYKIAQALTEMLNLDQEMLRQFADLVAIGSTADIVPLVDENRILVKEGLKRINTDNRPGLRALAQTAGLHSKTIGTGQIVFIIAPRINAVGRLGNAERAVRLLTTTNREQARNIAAVLESENKTRKDIDEHTFREAQEMVEMEYDPKDNRALVLDKDGWHPGVIGIVASRIVEKYYRPTVMISVEDGVGKASARSISGFDIYSALKQCEDLLVAYGGHKYAAGLTIHKDKIGDFRDRFNEIANEALTDEMLSPKLHIEAEIRLGEINDRFLQLLKKMAPFGPKNMRPVFLSRQLQVVGTPSIVGNNHLKFKVKQDNMLIDTIGFNLGDKIYRISPGEDNLDLVYVIEENEYLGRVNLQLRIKDLR